MNGDLRNRIEAKDTDIRSLLREQKFYIDYFQREYRWEEKHIKTLVEDLTNVFLSVYQRGDYRKSVASYQNYYLGPVVMSKNDVRKSIIDGQQRITSITLILIYLKHLQKEDYSRVDDLIFSETFGERSFNIIDEDRRECMSYLYEKGSYSPKETDSETVRNLAKRYEDIATVFPDDIANHCLPHFIDWLKLKVIVVEITAYSDENAYTIFETMNDRGLSLTSTEMLKGYVLSQITNHEQRNEINEIWKVKIQRLNEFEKHADQSFFQAWFRGKYAQSIRSGGVSSENKDFENIATRFHNWFKNNHQNIFELTNSDDFYHFFKNEFPFYVDRYLQIKEASRAYNPSLQHVFYIKNWGIADSLKEPLLLCAIDSLSDDYNLQKIDLVAKYIETFTVRRSINFRKFSASSIRYTMFMLIKKIRNNSYDELKKTILEEADKIPETFDGISDFRLKKMNRKFVKHLLSRISSFVDKLAGIGTSYESYQFPSETPFEIEHLLGSNRNNRNDMKTKMNLNIGEIK